MNDGAKQILESIASNAKRLLSDAELLAAAGRFPTSTALAILSIEEAGKYFAVRWNIADDARFGAANLRSHRMKQSLAFSAQMSHELLDNLEEIIHSLGYRLHFPAADNASSEPPPEALSLAEFEEAHSVDLSKILASRLAKSNFHLLSTDVKKGMFDRIKQSGFYVDFDDDGLIRSTPDNLTRKHATFWIEQARCIVGRINFDSD